ncbi:hypothetical protein M0812_13440 [Anaeramoeba flamelloides]|uniref:Uncharacterized protein n=1 Tax=Anaeramoeba flamelloides TaxID=1746091 RepID=A0AAV7ZHF8_9EUKA|nr:hypothetical protein M0812_13440 [Anaeramoeba flamelloides]
MFKKKKLRSRVTKTATERARKRRRTKQRRRARSRRRTNALKITKKKMKSKGNMGDTRDTTINVEKKCKKNVKHDPVIKSKQKCKEKRKGKEEDNKQMQGGMERATYQQLPKKEAVDQITIK